MRKLFSKRSQPYYICAPDYRRSSAGIRVMHMLCDVLNRCGCEAYISASVISPELVTPQLTNSIIDLHKKQGLSPVAVYPEIIDGNPFGCNTVVRYLLNKPGYIEGKGVYGERDIFFAYMRRLLLPSMSEDQILHLPAINSSIFCMPKDPGVRVPGSVCFYRGRKKIVDVNLLPAHAVEITASYPESWEELAELFQQTEYLYLFDRSGLATEAALCGCTVVMLSQPDPEENVYEHENKSFGIAWGLDSNELARARETLPRIRDVQLKLEEKFWPSLDRFIKITQEAAGRSSHFLSNHQSFWLNERVPSPIQRRLINERLSNVKKPVFCLVIVDFYGDIKSLTKTVSSLYVDNPLYKSFKVLVLTRFNLDQISKFENVSFFSLAPSAVSSSVNQALAKVSVDWFMVVEAGAEFTKSGLMIAALDLLYAKNLCAVYCDELVNYQNKDLGLVLKPDLNLDLLLSLPSIMSRHWFFNYNAWIENQGFRSEAGRAYELDYLLHLIEQKGFSGLGHISEPLLVCEPPALINCPDEREVIVRHLNARGYDQAEVCAARQGHYEVQYFKQPDASVSILIIVEGGLARLQLCVESILEKTEHAPYEILLLAKDKHEATVENWLQGVEKLDTAAVKVLRFSADLSQAQIQNIAAEHAAGEYLLWLDAGVAVLGADWLKQLLNHGLRSEVGAVGAKLVSTERKIANGGLVLGLQGIASSAFAGKPMDSAGYMQRLFVDQNHTGLSGQCLLVRRSLFIEAGGFDEAPELSPWAEVDLCLRLHAAGFLNVWTPRALLVINELAQEKATVEQEDAMYQKWLPLLARDPSYNPNFSLVQPGGFKLADSAISWRPLASWKPLPKILAHQADQTGCGQYRIIQPFNAMQESALIEGNISAGLMHVTDLERYEPDSIILQRQIGDDRLEAMRRMKKFSRAFKVYELDDYLPNLPVKSVHRAQMPKDIVKSLRKGLSFVDRFVVSTECLAEAFADMHSNILVVENKLPVSWWKGRKGERRTSKKPRVGWAGGASHTGDLEMIADVVRALVDEVHWVFFGMCPEKLRPYVHEFHEGVAIDKYPAALAALNLDLALAPVEQNLFNECKSNLRLLEYGACGFPVIASDVRCYQNSGLPVTLVKNRFRDWVEAIRMHVSDLDATASMADQLQNQVLEKWMLEGDNLNRWYKAWLPS